MVDTKIFQAINNLSGDFPLLDRFIILISNKVRYVYFFILIILWFRKHSRNTVLKASTSAFITILIRGIIKLFYYKPRPFMKRRIGILIPSKKDTSFPSKHTILVFAVSTSILFYNRTLGLFMSTLSFLTGFSRVWVGHHYPKDIVGSALIGSFTSIITEILFHSNDNQEN